VPYRNAGRSYLLPLKGRGEEDVSDSSTIVPPDSAAPFLKKVGLLLAVILVIGLLSWYGCVQFERNLALSFSSPYLFISVGATETYQSHFVTEGFQDRGVSLFVASASSGHAGPILIENLDAPWCRFQTAVWSGDGSVIACRADVITDEAIDSARKERKYGDGYLPPSDCTLYACAYDFRDAKAIVMNRSSLGAKTDWEAHSWKIEELLKLRGGPGKEVTQREIDEQNEKMDWAKWQVYLTASRVPPAK
jgi:hypothetical protein